MSNSNILPSWEKLSKEIIYRELGDIRNKKILDFGSGNGFTANHFAKDNEVIAIEPNKDMLIDAYKEHLYKQIIGDINDLKSFDDESFDLIICHNVLEYIDDKREVVNKLARVLKKGGTLSIVKHNRVGRVMQMAVLLDDFARANKLLDGKDDNALKFGTIKYYEYNDVLNWEPSLKMVDCFGVRTFFDLQQNQEKHDDVGWQEQMINLEFRVSNIKEYRDIAFFHHLLFRKI